MSDEASALGHRNWLSGNRSRVSYEAGALSRKAEGRNLSSDADDGG